MSTEQITFIQDAVPSLKSGTYEISVTQQIEAGGPAHQKVTHQFAVQGERFKIQPTEVNSVFPPNKATGEYGGCFPHIIFNRAMLPWLRSLSSTSPKCCSWLALLLFHEDEMSEIQSSPNSTVNSLLPNGSVEGLPSGHFSQFSQQNQLTLDYGEKSTDRVSTIDIPTTLFTKIAPSVQDMEYLAHVREVDITGKATGTNTGGKGSSLALGTYSVIIGNRMPKLKSKSTVYLVSLENMGSVLPGSGGNELANYNYVRLISLKRWSFEATCDGSALQTVLNNLIDSDGVKSTLRLPTMAPSKEAVKEALTALNGSSPLTEDQSSTFVNNALSMGYTALNHQTRSGSTTVSWYRGPFSPLGIKSANLQFPLHGDKLTNYDPKTGLFDVSYSTAWQLGQLLALQDKHFAVLQYQWKKQFRQNLKKDKSYVELLSKFVQGDQKTGLQHTLAQLFYHKLTANQTNSEDEQLTNMVNWLLKLRKLIGVPFNYLVPDDRMLPVNSLRFFWLDSNWIEALTYGALSIGSKPNDTQAEASILTALSKAETSGSTLTGFLLRSSVVNDWPGIVIKCLDANQQPLTKIRWERLSDSLLMAIFDGEVNKVEIYEPHETLHFGMEGTNDQTINLRSLNSSNAGEQVGPNITLTFREGDPQVLEVCSSAQEIQKKKHLQTGTFTSAEFAVQLVKSPSRGVYTLAT